MTIAWLFPGQGSQKVGMAQDLISLQGFSERFDYASEILGRDLLKICQGEVPISDSCNDLNDTRNTQAALFVIESLLVDDLKRQGRTASLVAGHSLGEFTALYAGEVIDFYIAIKLLKRRSELMAASKGGAMAAVLGFDRLQLETLVNQTDDVVIANDNSAEQVVLSGSPEAVSNVSKILSCKRVVPLNVSGAFHSPLMENAARHFSEELDNVQFKDSIFPILSNSDPSPTSEGILLKKKLRQQMTTGVRWRETMEIIEKNNISTVVEIGPGKVLSGLAKRSMRDISVNQIASSDDLGH